MYLYNIYITSWLVNSQFQLKNASRLSGHPIYYTNIVEHATGNPPVSIPLSTSATSDIIDDILSYYDNHNSIKSIKEKFSNYTFKLPLATENEILDIINTINVKKAKGIDNIPPKLVKLSGNVIKKNDYKNP